MISYSLGALALSALTLGALSETLPPLTGSDVLLRLLAVFLLIAINAFFVAAEFSIVSVRRSRISQLVSAGDAQAKTVQDLQRGLDRLLSTTQFGITLSSLALGWIGENTMALLLAVGFLRLPLPTDIREFWAHSIAIPTAFLLIAYLQIVLGELCPKALALLFPEQMARFLGTPSLAIARLFNPFIWVLNQSTRWLLQLFGVRYTGQGWYNRVTTPEELQLIISTSAESPGLEAEKRELLTNVFEFAEVSAGEVMVPRTSMVAVTSQTTLREMLVEVAASGHSRYPVARESLDDILGIIHFKELAEPIVRGVLRPSDSIQPWIRPAQFVSEEMPLNELLRLMRRTGQAMVIVVDEFGGTAGIVTVQDLAAEIIGETNEPESLEEPAIQTVDQWTSIVQAQLDLEEVNEQLNLDLPIAEDYQSLGGFMIYQLQKIPAVGETLRYQNYEMTVESMEGPRVERIRVKRLAAETDSETDWLADSSEPASAPNSAEPIEPDPLTDRQSSEGQSPDRPVNNGSSARASNSGASSGDRPSRSSGN